MRLLVCEAACETALFFPAGLCSPKVRCAALCSRVHTCHISLDCAPGSSKYGLFVLISRVCLCSREHKYCLIVLPGAHILLDCAPSNTNTAQLCSREQQNCLVVPLEAQIMLHRAPGSTNAAELFCRGHKHCWIVLPGAQIPQYLCSWEHKYR